MDQMNTMEAGAHHMQTMSQSPRMMEDSNAMKMSEESPKAAVGHRLPADHPENPFNWEWLKRIYVSACAFGFAFASAFGLTAYTAGIPQIVAQFNVSLQVAILGFSLYLFGIAFAPIWVPHASERFGRSPVYLITQPLFALFVLGASFSQNFASLAICRFLAGFFAGPALVLIEGTFADVWSADLTVTYYSVLTLASYLGAGAGPLVAGFLTGTSWRWTQWIVLIVALGTYLFGITMPETYGRAILRRQAKASLQPNFRLPKAQSGESIGEMLHITFLSPLKMLISEPLVILCSLYLGFNFAIIFSFFISIPIVLNLTYKFTVSQAGTAFTAALAGALLSAATCMLIDRITYRKHAQQVNSRGGMDIEYRLIPAMFGAFGIFGSLFWVGWTASPTISYLSPIFATVLYVWGNMSVLISIISYIFDAYPAAGTLSALTVVASFRITAAGIMSLFIIPIIMKLTGKWTYGMFGFIGILFTSIPFVLYMFGPRLRAGSRYTPC